MGRKLSKELFTELSRKFDNDIWSESTEFLNKFFDKITTAIGYKI